MSTRSLDLQCIFVGEFDVLEGPFISHQAPQNFITPSQFREISDYIVTEKELCFKTLVLHVFDRQLVGFPIRLENKDYARNYLFFNIVFVLSATANVDEYEPLVRKLAERLMTLELESAFMSNPLRKSKLEVLIPQMLHELQTDGESSAWLDSMNVVTLMMLPCRPDPPAHVFDHEVPIRIRNLTLIRTDLWDLALLQILPFINGVNYIRKIAEMADVGLQLVRECVRQLIYFDCVQMVDIFQYSNRYRIGDADQLHKLASNFDFQKTCFEFIVPRTPAEPTVDQLQRVFGLYCAFSQDLDVERISRSEIHSIGAVDMRKLVVFGLLNGLLVRVHEYPIRLYEREILQIETDEHFALRSMVNGSNSIDRIACSLSKSRAWILSQLNQFTDVVVVSR